MLQLIFTVVVAAQPASAAGPSAPRVEPPATATVEASKGVSPVEPSPEKDLDKDDEATPELEELRALEEVAIAPPVDGSLPLRQALRRLGAGSPLQDALGEALEGLDDSSEALPFVLAPVTDVKNFDVSLVRDRYDIPVEMQPLVEQYVRFFQGSGRRWFRRWVSRSHRYIPLMQPLLEANGMPRDLVYLAMIESGFNTQARSWAAAVGPWQFIAETGRRFGLKQDFWVDERRDPIKSTLAAGRYLKELHGQFGHWYLAWAGYNSGGGMVKRVIDRKGSTDWWVMSEGKGFRKETKHYVPKLIACALVARHAEAFGFVESEFEPEAPFDFDTVTLTEPVDLEILARAADTSVEVLKDLNPEVKRWCTPPASEQAPYALRIPKGRAPLFAENFSKLPPREKLNFAIHRVSRGDTLSQISARYHSAPEAILRMNALKSARALKLNSELIVPIPSARALAAGKADPFIERQSAQARRAGLVVRPEEEIPAGTQSAKATAASGTVKTEAVAGKTRVVYGVASGDTLWSISQRFDVSLGALREWNEGLAPKGRSLKVGTALTIWPGPKAELSSARAP